MNKKDGGPAFPTVMINKPEGGMTLRDYFAAQALTGLQIWDAVLNGKNAQLANHNGANQLAEIAYAVANEMLKAREQ